MSVLLSCYTTLEGGQRYAYSFSNLTLCVTKSKHLLSTLYLCSSHDWCDTWCGQLLDCISVCIDQDLTQHVAGDSACLDGRPLSICDLDGGLVCTSGSTPILKGLVLDLLQFLFCHAWIGLLLGSNPCISDQLSLPLQRPVSDGQMELSCKRVHFFLVHLT